ncbi:MAG: alanine racemase [Rectinemataceae bacterium]
MATLNLDPGRLRANLEVASRACGERGLVLLPVTKLFGSRPEFLAAIDHPALRRIADVDSARFADLDASLVPERTLLITRASAAAGIARHATRVMVSDLGAARAVGEARSASEPGRPIELVVTMEAGDLREGVPWEDAPAFFRELRDIPGIRVTGLAVNFGCLSGILPSACLLGELAERRSRLVEETGMDIPEFSLGGTVCWELLVADQIPRAFTEFRVGEALFVGFDTSHGKRLPDFSDEVFRLDLEVLEVWNKEVLVSECGNSAFGFNAFGETSIQLRHGKRRRAVLAGGENMAHSRSLEPRPPGLEIVGASHEHLVIDCGDAAESLRGGDFIQFKPGYESLNRCFLSSSVEILTGGWQ